MKKLIYILLIGFLLSSCAVSKIFVDERGEKFYAEPWGWANMKQRKIDGVSYRICRGNIIWSVIASETVIIPVVLTGWQMFEPVEYKPVEYKPVDSLKVNMELWLAN